MTTEIILSSWGGFYLVEGISLFRKAYVKIERSPFQKNFMAKEYPICTHQILNLSKVITLRLHKYIGNAR